MSAPGIFIVVTVLSVLTHSIHMRCHYKWVQFPGKRMLESGHQKMQVVNFKEECQQLCLADLRCVTVDITKIITNQLRCYFYDNYTDSVQNQSFTHYEYITYCGGK